MKKSRMMEKWKTDRALQRCASMIAYKRGGADYPHSGWYVRNYHSTVAMALHLKGKPHPSGHPWWVAYGDTGPFRTEEEARHWALGD